MPRDEAKVKFIAETGNFNDNINKANAKLKTLKSELKVNSEQMKMNGRDLDSLERRYRLLNEALEANGNKQDNLYSKYEVASRIYGENSKEVAYWEKRVADAGAEQIRLRKALDDCEAEMKNYQSSIYELTKKIEGQESELKNLKSNYTALVLEQGDSSDEAKKLANQITNLSSELRDNKNKLEEASNAANKFDNTLVDLEDSSKDAETATSRLENTIEKQTNELSTLKRRYSDLVLEQKGSSKEAKDLKNQIDNLSSELRSNKSELEAASSSADKYDNSLEEVNESSKKASNEGFTVMKGALANLVSDGIKLAKDALVDLTKETINTGINFDSEMSRLQALSGASADDMAKLRDTAIDLGAKTVFSATESAEALNYMAQAGWKTGDMLDGIDGVMNLAAASGEDLASVSEIVAAAIAGFGMEAKDSARFADVLARAAVDTNTDVGQMGETFEYVAPTAGALKYSIEDVSVAVGLMANAGIEGSRAGTDLNAILANLAKPTKQMQIVMNELGISLVDSSGKMKPFSQVTEELREKFSGLSEEEKVNKATTLAGKEAMQGFLAIINASPESYEALKESIDSASGSAEEMSKIMLDNLGGDIEELEGKIETAKLNVFEGLEPAMREGAEKIGGIIDGIDWQEIGETAGDVFSAIAGYVEDMSETISSAIDWQAFGEKVGLVFGVLSDFFKELPQYISTVIDLIKEYGDVIEGIAIAIGIYATAVELKNTVEGILSLAASMAALAPYILIVATIAAVIAIIVLCVKHWDTLKEKVKEVWNAICDTLSGWGEWINTNVIQPIVEFFSGLWDSVVSIFQSIIDWVRDNWQSIVAFFINPFAGVFMYLYENFEGFRNFIDGIVESVKGFFEGLWTKVQEVWDGICNVVEFAILFIGSILDGAFQLITLPFQFIWENCKNIVFTAWEWIKTTVSTSIDNVKTVISNVMEVIKGVMSTVWETIKSITSTVWDTIKTIISTVVNFVKDNIITPVFNAIKSFVTTIWDGIKSTTSSVWNGIKETISNIVNFVKDNIITPVFNAIKSFVTTIWDGIKSTTSSVWNGIKETISNIVNSIKDTVTNIFNTVKNTVSSIWNDIKSSISSIVNSIKSTITNIFNSIKSTLSSIWDGIRSTASSVWNGVKDAILYPIERAKDKVRGIVDQIKGFFSNMRISLPHIEMPHFSISGSFSLNPPSVPYFSISWYKDGAIFAKPTLFNTPYGLKGVGEAGPEAIMPIEKLKGYVSEAVSIAMGALNLQPLVNLISGLSNRPIYLNVNGRTLAKVTSGDTDRVSGLRNVLQERGLILE